VQIECHRVLQGGHAACILEERVEKATDNSFALSLLSSQVADADAPAAIGPSSAPAHFPTPLPALGPTTISTNAPVPC
jgi:hypothetical protein